MGKPSPLGDLEGLGKHPTSLFESCTNVHRRMQVLSVNWCPVVSLVLYCVIGPFIYFFFFPKTPFSKVIFPSNSHLVGGICGAPDWEVLFGNVWRETPFLLFLGFSGFFCVSNSIFPTRLVYTEFTQQVLSGDLYLALFHTLLSTKIFLLVFTPFPKTVFFFLQAITLSPPLPRYPEPICPKPKFFLQCSGPPFFEDFLLGLDRLLFFGFFSKGIKALAHFLIPCFGFLWVSGGAFPPVRIVYFQTPPPPLCVFFGGLVVAPGKKIGFFSSFIDRSFFRDPPPGDPGVV